MTKDEAKKIIESAFIGEFNESSFLIFVRNLFKEFKTSGSEPYVYDSFLSFVSKYKIIGYFEDGGKNKIDILEVTLNKNTSLERARTAQRNFIAKYLETNKRDAALVAFISPENKDWRLSLVKLEHSLEVSGEKLKTKEEITPAKRWSFLVGENEGSHTAQSRFVDLLVSDVNPNLVELETAFDIEKVTDEFFEKYKELYLQFKGNLDELIKKDELLKKDFEDKAISSVDFSKKTLGQIVFLYFLQKKGWFGVPSDKQWGEGPKKFIRELFKRREKYGKNFFNDILEPLFYEALAQDRGIEAIYPRLNNCRMPFLNGGLFEPMNGYKWETTDIIIPDELFSNTNKTKEGDIGDGILDIFDRYNFTVNENEPLEKEVAVDPEMLGKVFENLLDIKDRKSKGAFYTPREIVHYMCQESLINYLETETKNEIPKEDLEIFIRKGDRIIENDRVALQKIGEKEAKGYEYKGKYELLLPNSIRIKAEVLDNLLKNVKVADPAVGSGAFPLGMITEIVRARKVLNIYLNENISDYDLKLHTISHSIHGVDIDPGSVEIAKLRLWLALVVDEDTPHPLPNLDHKIMQGNSLISEYEGIKLFDESIINKYKKGAEQMTLGLGKSSSELKAQQMTLGLGKSSSELKMDALQRKTAVFVHESQRTKKQQLKEEIDNLKWELIEETLKEQGKKDKLAEIRELRRKNICPFFIWKLEFSDVFMNNGGFDVVIGNPPYVKEYTSKDAFDGLRESPYYQGKMDLWYMFACESLNLLKDNGIECLIAQNNWVTSSGASVMRNKVIQDTKILELIDFGNYKIFKTAGIQTMIMMFKKDTSLTEYHFDYRRLKGDNFVFADVTGILKKEQNTNTEYLEPKINRNILIDKTLTFSNSEAEKILEQIIKTSNFKLDEKEIAQGIVPNPDVIGKSNISKISKEKIAKYNIRIGDGVFVVSKSFFEDKLNDTEVSILKPLFEPTDLSKYFIEKENTKEIIYLTKKTKKEEIPNLLAHLEKYRGIMDDRRENLKGKLDFFHLHWSRDSKFFEKGPKILAVRKCAEPIFAYCEVPAYVMMSINVIKTNRINQKFLTGLLNSNFLKFWLKNKGKMQGNNFQVDKEPLIDLPLIKPSEEKQKEVESLVTQILTLKKSDPKADTSALESEIDRLVYHLYDLTPEEIAIVETSRDWG